MKLHECPVDSEEMMHPLIRLVRPKQWIKNLLVLAPLFFAQRFASFEGWMLALGAMFMFLLASCVVYAANDIRDANEDRQHPVKRLRPIASGQVSHHQALGLIIALLAGLLVLAALLPSSVCGVVALYLLLNVAYTLRLKHIALVDIFTIAVFYVLRVLAGCMAISVVVSPWIIVTTFLLALFLGFGKRYHEIGLAEYAAVKANLQGYSKHFLAACVVICAGATLLAYAIYAVQMSVLHADLRMSYTVLFVAFGLLRYLQHLLVYEDGGEPESILLTDRAMVLNILAWAGLWLWLLTF